MNKNLFNDLSENRGVAPRQIVENQLVELLKCTISSFDRSLVEIVSLLNSHPADDSSSMRQRLAL